MEALKDRHEVITQVRGMGLLLAVEFNSNMAAQVVATCNELGLLLNPVRPNAIRFMPPLTVTIQEVDEAIRRLEAGIKKALEEGPT